MQQTVVNVQGSKWYPGNIKLYRKTWLPAQNDMHTGDKGWSRLLSKRWGGSINYQG